mgnify:CR=1 FL=1
MPWPTAKDYAQKPVVSKGAGDQTKAHPVKTVKGAKKGKP